MGLHDGSGLGWFYAVHLQVACCMVFVSHIKKGIEIMKKLRKILSCLGSALVIAAAALSEVNAVRQAAIVLMGLPSVGKTSILYKGLDVNNPGLSTVNFDTLHWNYQGADENYSVTFWDTAGQERYSDISSLCLKRADVVMLVVSKDNDKSLSEESVDKLVNSVKDYAPGAALILVGNKNDIEDEEAAPSVVQNGFINVLQDIVDRKGIGNFFVTSAVTGYGIGELFGNDGVFPSILDDHFRGIGNYEDPADKAVKLTEGAQGSGSCCK